MTEKLLQKLEEKMMLILSEVEALRKENQSLDEANAALTCEKENLLTEKMHSEKKLQDLISLFDAVKLVEPTLITSQPAMAKPVLMQGGSSS